MTNPDDTAFPFDDKGPHSGLTKREYFAAMAMQGMISALSAWSIDNSDIIINRPQDIAEISITYADAIINELSK